MNAKHKLLRVVAGN